MEIVLKKATAVVETSTIIKVMVSFLRNYVTYKINCYVLLCVCSVSYATKHLPKTDGNYDKIYKLQIFW